MATKALSMVGTRRPGGVLNNKVKGLIDPKKLAGGFAGKLSGLLKKLGIPERIMKRLQGLAEGVVGELLSALKRRAERPTGARSRSRRSARRWGSGGVGEVLPRPLERLGVVQGDELPGEKERWWTRRRRAPRLTYGVLHAAGLNEGMAKDPFSRSWSGTGRRGRGC